MGVKAIASNIPVATPGLNVATGRRMMCSLIDFDFDSLRVPCWSCRRRTGNWSRHRLRTPCNIETGGAEGVIVEVGITLFTGACWHSAGVKSSVNSSHEQAVGTYIVLGLGRIPTHNCYDY